MTKERIRIEGTNIEELLYLRIKRLSSLNLCKKLIRDIKPHLDEAKLNTKAEGLASSVNSFLGFYSLSTPSSLNLWVLTRYYALMQITIAEQIVNRDDVNDLSDIENFTKQGHGLKCYYSEKDNVLFDFNVYVKKQGYFSQYMKYLGVDISQIVTDANITDSNVKNNLDYLIPLEDIFLRIPELSEYNDEYFSKPRYCFQLCYDSIKNHELKGNPLISAFSKNPPSESNEVNNKSYILICNENLPNDLNSYDIPFKEIKKDDGRDSEYFSCYVEHDCKVWWDAVKHYKSTHSGSNFITPLKNKIDDIISLHFMILYSLSIIVRYYPSIWDKIERNEYNEIRSLIEYYLTIFDKIILKIMVERIEGKKVYTALPGGMNSTI